MLESLFRVSFLKLQAYFNSYFLVNIAKFFDSKSLVASSLLDQKQCETVSAKKGRSCHSTRYLNTLVETISTRFY